MLFKDGSSATYDRALHSLTIDLPTEDSSLTVTVNGNVTLSATGNALVEADGNATVSAGSVARIEAGSEIQMVAPAVNITSTVTVSNDVVAGGISLKTHKHGGVQGGSGQTSTPV
jgi:phage baseplate assembly protein V